MEAAATAAAEYQRELMLGMSDKARRLGDWAAQVGRGPNSGPERGFENSSAQLRDILRRGLIKMTDLRDDPEWFFEAHRVVGAFGEELGPGFWTRFTVQFNLVCRTPRTRHTRHEHAHAHVETELRSPPAQFAGTVLAVGNADQIEQLNVMQAAGQLGCFALTEKFAGVSSGMVVETTAEFDATTRTFVLNSPSAGAYKNWISQGFCADKSVVVADLRVGGKSHGPHAFLIDFRLERNGQVQLVDGVSLADMGRKTVANDLDNAWIAFDNVSKRPRTVMRARCRSVTATPPEHLARFAEGPARPRSLLRAGARARERAARPLRLHRRGGRLRAERGRHAHHGDDRGAPLHGASCRRRGCPALRQVTAPAANRPCCKPWLVADV